MSANYKINLSFKRDQEGSFQFSSVQFSLFSVNISTSVKLQPFSIAVYNTVPVPKALESFIY